MWKLQLRVMNRTDQNDPAESLAKTLNWLPVWASSFYTNSPQLLQQGLKSLTEIFKKITSRPQHQHSDLMDLGGGEYQYFPKLLQVFECAARLRSLLFTVGFWNQDHTERSPRIPLASCLWLKEGTWTIRQLFFLVLTASMLLWWLLRPISWGILSWKLK